jgi:hypothetical protein
MAALKQYQIVEMAKDFNPVIKMGMRGIILEPMDEHTFIVEFVTENGKNIAYNDEYIFIMTTADIKI